MKTTLLLLLFPALVHAGDDWSITDKALFATSSALLVIDWGQTRYIAKHPNRFYEKNVLLGKHPSVRAVNAYFIGALVGNYLLTDRLDRPYRTYFQAGLIGLELVVTASNKKIGIRIQF